TPGSELSECEIIKAAMIAGGIPPDRILEEHRAMNTGENVIFSLPILDGALGLTNIRSVICLGNSWTARRYPMTLHRHWPEVEKMLISVDSFETPLALAHRSRVPDQDPQRMGQDRTLQGQRLHRGVAGAGKLRA